MTAELRSLDFHGEVVFLVAHPESGKPFIPVKPLCVQLGMAWQPQHRKLVSDDELWGCNHMVIPSPDGPQTMTCLPLENLNGWLFGIQASRVKPEFREKLRAYQKECFQVLDAYWRTGAAIRPEVRAAAPQATRALFDEMQALTGLDPETAQPAQARLRDWQVRCMEARLAVIRYLEDFAEREGLCMEKAMLCFQADAELHRLPPEIQALLPLANARTGPSGARTISRRSIQRWRADAREGLAHLAPLDHDRPDPAWLPQFQDILAQEPPPSLADAWRLLCQSLPGEIAPPSYDAAVRWSRKVATPRPPKRVRFGAGTALTAELIRELRALFGDEGAKASLKRMFPDCFALEGGAQ